MRIYVVVFSMLLFALSFVVGCGGKGEDNEHLRPEEASSALRGGFSGLDLTRSNELRFDDGSLENRNSPWGGEPGGQVAVRFSPPAYPVSIEKVGFFVCYGGPYETEFRVRVYGGDATAGPAGEDLIGGFVVATAMAGDEWLWVDVSSKAIEVAEGDFFVAMEWLTAPGDDGGAAQQIGADATTPRGRSWWKHDAAKQWIPIAQVGNGDRNLMIRAVVRPLAVTE